MTTEIQVHNHGSMRHKDVAFQCAQCEEYILYSTWFTVDELRAAIQAHDCTPQVPQVVGA